MTSFYSVIVPVYKVEPYLRQCLDSILAQTYPCFELILVDDGSPDGCPAICEEYKSRDERVSVIHKQNEGLALARLSGLERARYDYVCFVDSDDYVPENWLETIHTALENNGFPDMLLFGLTHFGESGGETELSPPELAPGYYDKRRLEKEVYPYMLYDARRPFFQKTIAAFMWAKVFRRDLCMAHYTRDRRVTMYEDVAMIYECIYCASSMAVLADCPYYYRSNPQSILGRYHPEYIENLQYLNLYLKERLGRLAPELLVPINAYISMRTIDAIVQEFLHGRRFWDVLRHTRAEMDRMGLARDIDTRGLPSYIRLFIGLLKRRLYFAAVLGTKIRLKQTAGKSDN